jgi:hypothetical protein
MNYFKKLRDVVMGCLLLIGAGALPASAWFTPTYFETNKVVSVATTPATPTLILADSPGDASVKLMLHWGGTGTKPNGEYLLLSDSNVAISTSSTVGAARIPAGNSVNEIYDLGDYRGAVYGVVLGTTSAQLVSVIRKR